MDEFTMRPLGWLRADFRQKFGTPRQGALAKNSRAEVELAPEWRGRGLFSGLEGFSHVWIVSYLHLSQSKRKFGKVHPPRLGGAKVGVMGSRSPHRPNNIGLTLARLVSCEGDSLALAEVDLVDGTPILDLKPYLASADRPETFTSGWTESVDPRFKECVFSAEFESELAALRVEEPSRVRALIEEMLTQDPRPPAYLGRDDANFKVWVSGLNVLFRYFEGRFTVTGVERV